MSQLLSIETSFLNLPQVKQGLNLQEIRSVQRTIVNAKKKKFEQTLALSKLVNQAVEWFQSEAGQRVCAEEGISWSNEEIGQKVFGWQKSFFYKVVKAGKLDEAVIDTFKAKCDEAETRGEDPNRSLEGLLKFAKAVESGATEGGEGEDSEGGDASEAQVETRIETILTFTYKSEGGNVSVRIDAEGNVKTTNSAEQIREAIAVLNFSIQNQNQ
jgi:hypothetical protein